VTRCDLQATRQELETDLAAVEALTWRGGGENAGALSWKIRPCLTDPRAWQQFTKSSRPWLITTVGLPVRMPLIYPPSCREKQPTSYTV
jgi:hypothetical protein